MSSAWASASAHRLVPLNESTIYWEANPRWHTEMLLRDCVLCLRNGEAPCLPLPGARRQCSSQQCSPQQLPLKPVGLRQNWASAAHILQHRTVLIIGDSLAGQQYDAMTGNATLAWSSRHLTGVQNASTTNGETCVYGTGVLNPCILERRVIEPLQTAVQFIRHSVTALPPGFDAEIRAADWLILGGWHKSKRTMPLPRDAAEKLLTSALKLRGTPARILLTEDVGAAFPGPVETHQAMCQLVERGHESRAQRTDWGARGEVCRSRCGHHTAVRPLQGARRRPEGPHHSR